MNIERYLEGPEWVKESVAGKECITALFKCFEANGIDLESLPKFHSIFAARRGLPFTFIGQEHLDHPIFAKICKHYAKYHEFNEDDFSEASAAALLIGLIVRNIYPVERTSDKTYDFNGTCGETDFEIEVTRAGEKDEWSKRMDRAGEIADLARDLGRNFSFSIFVENYLTDDELLELKSKLSGLKVGQSVDEKNRWLLIAEEPHGNPSGPLLSMNKGIKPEWWPEFALTGFSVSGMVATQGLEQRLPSVDVRFSCPFKGYINRVKKKATEFQGTGTRPFLLVLNATALVGSFGELEKNFHHYFPDWIRITAVLVYIEYFDGKELGWEFQFFINPHARQPFGDKALDQIRELTIRKRFVKHFI